MKRNQIALSGGVGLVLAALFGAATIARAQSSDENTITACVDNTNGGTRILAPDPDGNGKPDSCHQNETAIVWGIVGPKGDKGDTGATGPVGPAGPVGPTGPQGPAGSQGIPGEDGVCDPGQCGGGGSGGTGGSGGSGGSGGNGECSQEGDTCFAGSCCSGLVCDIFVGPTGTCVDPNGGGGSGGTRPAGAICSDGSQCDSGVCADPCQGVPLGLEAGCRLISGSPKCT